MMGLLLAVGMLVDNAVVVVESIYHYRERFPDRPWYAAVQSTQVVGVAIAAGTLSSIIVFLPMVFGEKDNISIFLTQVAITMAIAHLASWLVAVSLVPMLSARLPPPKFIGRKNIITRVQAVYGRFIAGTLSHRRWTMIGLLVLMIVSIIGPAMHTKMDMFPAGDSDRLFIGYRLNAMYPLKELQASVDKIEGYLNSHREEFHIKNIYSSRYAEDATDTFTSVLFDKNDKTRPTRKSSWKNCAKKCRKCRSAKSFSISTRTATAVTIPSTPEFGRRFRRGIEHRCRQA